MVVHDKVKERILAQLAKQKNRVQALNYLHRFNLTDPEYLALVDTLADYKEVKEQRNGSKPQGL